MSEERLAAPAAAAIRAAVRLAGGREVCFVATLDAEGIIRTARVVARGDVASVLALPGFAARGEMLLHNHPSGVLDPSDADMEIAARIHDDGVGFGIVDNAASRVYVVVEVPRASSVRRLDPDAVVATLGRDGPIATRLAAWEDRPSQRDMARRIARLYNGGGIGLLEAGTGVGKSLGYLLPALRWAALNGEPTVVSTNTINLQEQLVGKDLPFLAGALDDQPVRFALLKGWHNYLCLQRLEQAEKGSGTLFDADARAALAALRQWAERTTDGSLADLSAQPSPAVWDEVAAEPDLCTRVRCPHFDRCFLFRARRRAAQADVIVVNHHLLLSDLAVRRARQSWNEAAVLPAYRRLVVDEGQHLEDAAAMHLGVTVTRLGVQRLLARFDRRGKGLLATLQARLRERDDLLSVASLDLVQSRVAPSVTAARAKAALMFQLLEDVLAASGGPVLRLTEEFAEHPAWGLGLDAAFTDFLGEVAVLGEALRLVRERLEVDETSLDALAALLGELRGVTRRLEDVGDGLGAALRPAPDTPATVRWIERRGRDDNLAVTAVPLDVAPVLRSDLFERLETAIVTSATLAVDGRFDYVRSRLGLDQDTVEPETAVFPSPFDYGTQALLALPTDVPAPNVDPAAHGSAVSRMLLDLLDACDGGAFALFTSHREVRATAALLRASGAEGRWPILVHGEEARDALLRRFRDSGRSVLLGTSSFWEGVDVIGPALRALLIAKLPFRVPAEPLTAARCEEIEARGGDAFREYMLPDAGLRLKQGFGRLIRSCSDTGVVVLCDPRVVTKGYGRELLAALPPARCVTGVWEVVRREVARFYAGRVPRLAEDGRTTVRVREQHRSRPARA